MLPEDWRRQSLIGQAAMASIQGFGWRSYTAALRTPVEYIDEQAAAPAPA